MCRLYEMVCVLFRKCLIFPRLNGSIVNSAELPGEKVKWREKNFRKLAKYKAIISVLHLENKLDDKTSENRTRF